MPESFAPYNFIPFSDVEPPVSYEREEDLYSPVQHQFGTDNEGKSLRSGWIDYSIRNLTPICVGREDRSGFSQDGRGRYIIPGSTMRGFVRSHAEILSLSYPELVDADQRYLYRKVAGGYVDGGSADVRKKYQEMFGMDNSTTGSKAKAGWLYSEGDNWYIQPVKEFAGTGKTYFAVHEELLIREGKLSKTDRHVMKGKDYKYEPYGLKMNRIGKIYSGTSEADIINFDLSEPKKRVIFPKNGGGRFKGALMNSAFMHQKKHHLIVSLEAADCERIEVDQEMVEDYRRDLERTQKVKRKQDGTVELTKAAMSFYTLPEEGEKKLFFYIEDETAKKKKADDSDECAEPGVGEYAVDDSKRKVRIISFGPTKYYRIPFDHSVADGIPMKRPEEYDYIRALFGYVDEEKKRAYKSRLSFQNAVYTLPPEKTEKLIETVDVVLNSPQGTAFHMYLDERNAEQGSAKKKQNGTKKNQDGMIASYNDDSFRLRGYKFYWKRSEPVFPKEKGKKAEIYSTLYTIPSSKVAEKANDGNAAIFIGRIYFKNLRVDELGLVLKSLQFFEKEGLETYSIGGGKPYGFGKIEITGLRLHYQEAEDFSCVNPEDHDATDTINELKEAFVTEIEKRLNRHKNGAADAAGMGQVKYNERPSVIIYKQLARCDNADSELGTDPMHIYMEPGTSKTDNPGYGNYYPLPIAATIFERLGKSETRTDSEEEYIVWLGSYNLSGSQRNLLYTKSKLRTKNEKGCKKLKEGIEKYANEYTAVALPSDALQDAITAAKEKYRKVWKAVRKGRIDSGWDKLK